LAQLGVTEERATAEVLDAATALGVLDRVDGNGFRASACAYPCFQRLALALDSVGFYADEVHRDDTTAQVVLTKPPQPSALEDRLAQAGWMTADLELTEHAFRALVQGARQSVFVMTPFLDEKGARWLVELLSSVRTGVARAVILRSLEDKTRSDYPPGFNVIASWLQKEGVAVFNYSLPRPCAAGRETFHAKAVVCDCDAAYIGSSNLTAASLEYSMEMGVLLRGRAASDARRVIEAVVSASRRVF
jgi:phosphatidylserine/phosphatidylglycerophosphate/cardiolipin synthase-like enzyme